MDTNNLVTLLKHKENITWEGFLNGNVGEFEISDVELITFPKFSNKTEFYDFFKNSLSNFGNCIVLSMGSLPRLRDSLLVNIFNLIEYDDRSSLFNFLKIIIQTEINETKSEETLFRGQR